MYFLALATDYDGTLASSGVVQQSTIAALEKLRASGRKLLLVTGRQIEDLLRVFPHAELFEWIVAENGALLYCPRTRDWRLLTEPVPAELEADLRRRGVDTVDSGRAIVSTWRPHECTVLEALRDLGIDRQIIFNKRAVMVLPTGINKSSGLMGALNEVKISPHNVVAVGDAENDLPMLKECACGVAVANALDSVKEQADLVTSGDHGAGVEELIAEILDNDLARWLEPGGGRGLLFGSAKEDPERSVMIPSLGHSVLVAGPSGSGKSTAITGLIERLAEAAYQFCLFDPEGDYEGFEPAVNLGNPHYEPGPNEVLTLLERAHSAVVNLLGIGIDRRPAYVSEVVRKLDDLRHQKGRPHWMIFDEAHHIFPSHMPPESTVLPGPPATSLMITVHPRHMRKEALAAASIVIAVGKDPHETLRDFCRSGGVAEPALDEILLDQGEALVWFRTLDGAPFVVKVARGKTEHRRHIRKYAQGDMGSSSFVFRGPQGKLNLTAQNFDNFVRMGAGVDEETWLYHLRAHDYSRWMRDKVKDLDLAREVEEIENEDVPAARSREQIFAVIRGRYTAAA